MAGGRAAPAGVPDPELVEQAKRRSFTAEYKAKILAKADACTRPGEVGELLRAEGLYTSHLTYWRKQRKDGALRELGKPRGRKPADKRDEKIAQLERKLERSETELAKMKRVVEIQGKRLSAAGRDARSRQREQEHRAMIAATVEELTPIIGTRPACRALGASPATVYRSRRPPEPRPRRPRPTPERALSEPERQQVLEVLHSERFVDVSPEETWATLLDEGSYLCSPRTMYRILAAHHGGVRERRAQLTHPPYAKPELLAERPNELWSWDVSKLKGPAKWTYYYLYVIIDVFSRFIVGWTVQYRENAQLAKALIEQATEQQQITPKILTLHADRGAPQRAKPVAFLLADLGITKTHSRPYTSSDNPYSESNFKTLKYRPEFPARFDDIEHARAHCRTFVDWYNHAHRHSGIGLMTPAAIHHGHAEQLHAARAVVLDAAYQQHPERFVRKPPAPPELPAAAWINKPADTKEAAAH
ncbi:MAG: IS3 family transposase [Solirubrobacteraceae bacterium]